MAAVIGDYGADPSRFHNVIATSGLQHQHAHESSHYRSDSRSRDSNPRRTSASPVYPRSAATSAGHNPQGEWETTDPAERQHTSVSGGASRFPSPPSSS